jgi:hypothetical protein
MVGEKGGTVKWIMNWATSDMGQGEKQLINNSQEISYAIYTKLQ